LAPTRPAKWHARCDDDLAGGDTVDAHMVDAAAVDDVLGTEHTGRWMGRVSPDRLSNGKGSGAKKSPDCHTKH